MRRNLKTRRLTKAEATRLGVSHKAKRRVSVEVKKVTRSTRLYTDREIATARIRQRIEHHTGKRLKGIVSREKYAILRKEYRTLKGQAGVVIEFKNLDIDQLFALIRKYRDHVGIVKFFGIEDSVKYKNDVLGRHWVSSPRILLRGLLKRANWEDFKEDIGVAGVDEEMGFGLIVYPETVAPPK